MIDLYGLKLSIAAADLIVWLVIAALPILAAVAALVANRLADRWDARCDAPMDAETARVITEFRAVNDAARRYLREHSNI